MTVARVLIGLLALLPSFAAHAEPQPVVAVFAVKDASGRLKPEELSQLTSYLTAKIAAGGRFQVVPQAQLKQAFDDQKKASYEACYDEACQIEIGREVAAQKTLNTEIVQLGQSCAVTATLFDLARAASEMAATERGACDIDALVESIERMAQKLSGSEPPTSATVIPAPAPAEPAAQRPEGAVDVLVESTPGGAAMLLDGKFVGATPLRVPLVRGRRYDLRLDLAEHEPLAVDLSYDDASRLHYTLAPTSEALRNRTGWIALGPTMAVSFGETFLYGARLQAFDLRFDLFEWILLDASFGVGSGELLANPQGRSETGLDRSPSFAYFVAVGTQPGLSFSLDDGGQHQISAGVGIGAYHMQENGESLHSGESELDTRDRARSLLGFWPSLRYLYTTDSGFFIGLQVRAVLAPIVESGSPQLFSVDLPLGFAN